MIGMAYSINDPTGASISLGTTGQYTATSSGTANAQGGNATNLNLSSNSSTIKWQGFYGNVSGGIRLGSGSNVFYNFGNAIYTTVFATQDSGFNWATMAAGTAAQVDTAWSFGTASDVDQAVDIYSATTSFAGVSGAESLNTSTVFETGILNDGASAVKNDFAFAANVISAGASGFDGNNYQYQLMVPVGTGFETYNFYLSLE